MSGTQVMVVLIVMIVMLASVIRSKHGHRRRPPPGLGGGAETLVESSETRRLRDEVKQLKERLAVIERITIEKENSLSQEIERLRGPN